MALDERDIRVDIWRAGINGGPINLRLTHVPTGTVVSSDGSDKSEHLAKKRLMLELERKIALDAFEDAVNLLDPDAPVIRTPHNGPQEP